MIRNKLIIRPAADNERDTILALTEQAFGRQTEASLVDALISEPVETPSFVAELEGEIVGHVMYSQLDGPPKALGLGPLSVSPAWQDMHVGTELTRQSLERMRNEGWSSVFLLGAPTYYERFGFKSSTADPMTSQYQGPYFLAKELQAGALAGYSGEVKFAKPFSELAP